MYRAVIVDDEPFMLEGMRLMVDWQRCGFELCGEAASAQEALHLVDSLRPHLLITDIRMPGMLGTDLASIISHYHPEVIILFFSVFKDFSYAQSAIRAHAFGYLVKPIDVEEVHDTLLRVKTELDSRAVLEPSGATQAVMLRDQVLRRIALGDDSPESLMRASVLLLLKHGDPCYCAVLARALGPIPENVKLLLTTCGAVPFQLSPGQYGLGFQQFERDLPALIRLMNGLAETVPLRLSVGRVYRGAEGFARSLREALDAQGVLFEHHGVLRLYRAFDTRTAEWLAKWQPSALREAVVSCRPDHLDAALAHWRKSFPNACPDLFALRYLAATLDAMLPAVDAIRGGSFLKPLWQEENLSPAAWTDAFCHTLHQTQDALQPGQNDDWPEPVQAAMQAIRTQYAQTLSMGGIAEKLHLNPAYLGQLVRRYTGATFHRQLLDTRLEHACVLLRQTSLPVGEIAMDVGFRDVDYFSQQFRGRMGMSPGAYRNAEATIKENAHAPNQ